MISSERGGCCGVVVCHGLQVRDLVLQYFNADPAEYQVVFTRSATGALKLVGETFPWSKCVMLLAAAAAEVDDHAMSVRWPGGATFALQLDPMRSGAGDDDARDVAHAGQLAKGAEQACFCCLGNVCLEHGG